VLLLYYLLQEEQERERRRLLIDTILRLSKKSAAAVCRVAGVQPANLSAFRRPKGANLVSSELQDRLLAVLGWSGGEPDLGTFHEWVVRDTDGLISLRWILKDRSTIAAKIRPSDKPSPGKLDLNWQGNLADGGAPCQISVGSYLKLPDGTSVGAMMSSLIDPEIRAEFSSQHEADEKFDGVVAKAVVRQVLMREPQGLMSHRTGGLFDHLVTLGITDEILDRLVEDWVCQQPLGGPDSIVERLFQIKEVRIGNESVHPSAMTKTQLKNFLVRLGNERNIASSHKPESFENKT
jgi:hypothetical protein